MLQFGKDPFCSNVQNVFEIDVVFSDINFGWGEGAGLYHHFTITELKIIVLQKQWDGLGNIVQAWFLVSLNLQSTFRL